MTKEAPELTEADRGYFASLVDERGLIYVSRIQNATKTKTQLKLRLDFNGLSEGASKWIVEKFPSAKRCGSRTYFVTDKASAALAMVYSDLKNPVKKAQAQLVFKFNGIKPARGRIWSAEEQAQRWTLKERINRPAMQARTVKLSAPVFEVTRIAGGQ